MTRRSTVWLIRGVVPARYVRRMTTLDSVGAAGPSLAINAPPRAWRTVTLLAVCAVVGFLLSAVTMGLTLDSLPEPTTEAQDLQMFVLMGVDLLGGLAALALLPWIHRRKSVLGVALGALLSGFSMAAALVAAYGIVTVAATRNARNSIIVGAVLAGAGVLGTVLLPDPTGDPLPLWQTAVAMVTIVAILTMIGLVRGHRQAALIALQREAVSAQEAQAALLRERAAERRVHEARLAETRSAERAQIAREMHDTLAHQLSLIALHAGTMEYRELDPEQSRLTAATIAAAARQAGAELRQVLTVLRNGEGSVDPLPDLSRLPSLVDEQVDASKINVIIEPPLTSAQLDQLPPATSRHLYRIVQECLTNARKHAPGLPVQVTLSGSVDRGMTLHASNPLVSAPAVAPAVPGSGLGLEGVVERARLSGGWCRVSRDDTHFAVTAWVPWG